MEPVRRWVARGTSDRIVYARIAMKGHARRRPPTPLSTSSSPRSISRRWVGIGSVNDVDSLVCEDFVMAPGDVLYMPKGVVSDSLGWGDGHGSDEGEGRGEGVNHVPLRMVSKSRGG